MIRPLQELKNIHAEEDAWVIAAGPSAGLIDPAFFDGKLTIGVNRIWDRFDVYYLVIKEGTVLDDALESGAVVVASHYHCGALGASENEDPAGRDFYRFDHADNKIRTIDPDEIGGDRLVVSYSTITSAIHLAAYMGAANIILVGHDCGTLDGERNFNEYPDPLSSDPDFYGRFLKEIEPQTVELKRLLKSEYGCRIYSLNPFINFGLEGARYER